MSTKHFSRSNHSQCLLLQLQACLDTYATHRIFAFIYSFIHSFSHPSSYPPSLGYLWLQTSKLAQSRKESSERFYREKMSRQTKDESKPTRTVSLKANRPSLKISIPSSNSLLLRDGIQPISNFKAQISPVAKLFSQDVRNKHESRARPEIISPDRLFSIKFASFQADNNAGDITMKKARVPSVSFSSACNSHPWSSPSQLLLLLLTIATGVIQLSWKKYPPNIPIQSMIPWA